ncbi:MAG: hypothetical protein M1419_09050 [Bacteroidetes bacterium]|nr:hypothetical protein [Bacteroidota bacterium]
MRRFLNYRFYLFSVFIFFRDVFQIRGIFKYYFICRKSFIKERIVINKITEQLGKARQCIVFV